MMASNLFQVLEGITVDQDDIKEAEFFAENYLAPLYPDLDLRPGTGVRDQVIRPNATLIALLRKGLNYYFATHTLAGVTDDSPTETVDDILSNWFMTRLPGVNAEVGTRLYFTQAPSEGVTVSTSYWFSTDNTVFFNPIADVSFSQAEFTLDNAKGLYYVDTDMQSEAPGDEYNLDSGQLLYFSVFNPYFVSAEILFLKTTSIGEESNTDLIERSASAISTRNLINDPSIQGRILELFNYVTHVTAKGMADPVMLRDLASVLVGDPEVPAIVHRGGFVDVYASTSIVQALVQFQLDGTGKFTITGDNAPTFKVEQSTITEDGKDPDTVPSNTPFTVTKIGYDTVNGDLLVPYEQDNGFSSSQEWVIDFGAGQANGTATMILHKFLGIPSIQNYLNDKESRVICANYMARALDLYHLDIHVNAYGVAIPSVTIMRPLIEAYLNSLVPGAPFVMSELMEILSRDAGIENLATPIQVSFTRYQRNFLVTTGVISDILEVDDLSHFVLNDLTSGNLTI